MQGKKKIESAEQGWDWDNWDEWEDYQHDSKDQKTSIE